MRVLLDDRPCEGDAASVGEAISSAAAVAGERGRVVVEVIVDGVSWTDRELDSTDMQDSVADEVSLVTADLRDLVCETLSDAANALADADAIQREAAELIQIGRHPEAMKRLAHALEIWRSFHEAVSKSAEAVPIDLAAIRVGDDSVEGGLGRLRQRLQEIRSALEANDPVGLSDTLMYDLPDIVIEWRSLLEAMIAHVRGTDVSPLAKES